MKKLKRITAVLLIVTLALTLAGCGFAAKMSRAAKKMEKLQSYRMDIDLDMELKLSVLGQSLNMDMNVDGRADINTSPAVRKMDTHIRMLGLEQSVLVYTEKTDAGVTTFRSSDGGETWTRKTRGSEEAAPGKSDFTGLLKIASGFEKTGTETVRGSEATIYSGVITGADLENAAALSDVLKNAFSSMDMPLDGLDLAAYGSIPTTIDIDNKSGMIVRCTMDLTEFMGKMMPALMDAVMGKAAAESGMEGFDLSALRFSAETGRVFTSLEFYDFDAVGTIEIPAEALTAPEAAA